LIQVEDRKKEMFELKKAPRMLQKKTSRMMIIRCYTVKGSSQVWCKREFVSEFEMEDRDLMQYMGSSGP
jgi:hypothetical protein